MLVLFFIISLAAAFLIAMFGRKSKLFCHLTSILATLSLFLLSLYALYLVNKSGVIVYNIGGWIPPLGICLVLDGFSAFMLLVLNFISFIVAIYALAYMEKYTDKYRFYCLFMCMITGMNGVILAGDIFNLFVCLEIASVASYALVAFGTEAEELEAAFKYIVMGAIAASFILLGIGLLYAYTSTLNMADISLAIAHKGFNTVILLVSVLFIAGFGTKSALVPFHGWLPDAHSSAPAAVSAMLSGVLIKVLGIYSLVRIFFNIFGVNQIILMILAILGAISILVGAILAIGQWDLKRLLAYSSISQIGYVILSLSLATPLGILGGLFHLFNHSVFKSLLFLNSGAIEYATGCRNLKEMGGLKEKMPITANTSWIASLSISGIPPFSGFWSKLLIIIACVQANRIGLALIAVAGSIITLAYFMKVQKVIFYGKLNPAFDKIKEVPVSMRLAMIVLAVLCLLGGILFIPRILVYFLKPAVSVLLLGTNYAFTVLGGVL
ncbi:MAG: monovalent cation/H+ antiporter subunit D family protein [Candidatus Omnitrophica bacterium]|nr:monovalent cation/H+ antiporter subunit D family protein [Candidatus Omnitrophota bacterium]MDD5352501.1 monovalent cation/H+ antiporter subunit D family protein [Candidatus Omnitrophota bacterium]MDD5550099.1 monovalent cation/H+ antiporter subunit D family protein [Candidatus Omnitrophota bacterium]